MSEAVVALSVSTAAADHCNSVVKPGAEGLPIFHHHLPAEEIHPLDPRRTLVDRMDPDVPVVLLQRKLIAVTVAAQALESLAHREDSHLRRVALGDGGEKVEEEFVSLFLLSLGHQGKIHILGALEDEGERSFNDGALEEEHPLHVGMFDDRDLRRQGILPGDGPPLRPLPGILQGGAVGGRCDCRSPHPHIDARFVHHLEHVAEPLVGFANQPAPAVVAVTERELGDRRAAVA